MTEPELRKRAALFMAELAVADVAAGVPARAASPNADGARPLVDALQRFLERYSTGERWERWTDTFNAYVNAYRRARREAPEPNGEFAIMRCGLCETDVGTANGGVLAHVLSIGHLARAEGRAARKRAS